MEEDDLMALYQILDLVNKEANNTIKLLFNIRQKGKKLVKQAEAVTTPALRPEVKELTKSALNKLKETLSDINSELELSEVEFPKASISYCSVGEEIIEVTFLTGESPWNFWLQNEKIDSKKLQKDLLKKYQSDLLEPNLFPEVSESVCFLDRNKVFRGIVLQVNLNSVKVLDCDSNLTRVVARDRVFEVDLDACHSNASTFKCTINKDSDSSQSWDSYLRDIFCNSLKEASLRVKILEKLPSSFPTFIVDVWMCNDEGESANLQEWVLNRLLMEVNSLSKVGDFDPDLLSAEALNPFFEGGPRESMFTEVSNTKPAVEVNLLDKSDNDKINNLNNNFNNVTVKCVTNVEINDDLVSPLEPNSSEIVSSSEEISSSCSSSIDKVETKSNSSSNISNISSKVENNLSWPKQEFQPICPAQSIPFVPPQSVLIRGFYPSKPAVFQPPTVNQPVPLPYQNIRVPIHNNMISPPYMYQETSLEQRLALPTYSPPNWRQPAPSLAKFPPWTPKGNPPVLQASPTVNSTSWSSENLNYQLTSPGIEKNSSNNANAGLNVLSHDFVPMNGNYPNNKDLNPMGQEFVPKSGVSQHYSNLSSPGASKHSNSHDTPVLPAKAVEDPVYFNVRKPSSLLKPYDNLLVLISHVESPSEFYINFVTDNNRYMDKLTKDMFEYYNKIDKVEFNTCQAAQKALGKFCACKWHEDNHWYRAEALEWDHKKNRVKVFFVDFGNSDFVAPSCLQPLTRDFCKLSQIAQRCHLNKTPMYKDKEWSEESLAFFKGKALKNEFGIFTVTVVPATSMNTVDNSLSVRLYEGRKTHSSTSINDMLVECAREWTPRLHQSTEDINSQVLKSSERLLPLPSQINSQGLDSSEELLPPPPHINSLHSNERLSPPPPHINSLHSNERLLPPLPNASQIFEEDMKQQEEWDKWDPQAEDYESLRNNPSLDTDDAGVALVGYKAQDETRICRFYAQNGCCWKSYCSKEHIRPNPDGVTTDQVQVYTSCLSEITMPSVGEELNVKVTHVESINQFYVQLEEDRATSADCDDEEIETMTLLQNYINRPDNVQKMKKLMLLPALGELVLAKYEDTWYRGRIFSTSEEEDPEVMFVDYGNICSVSEKDLRAMEPQYLHLPFQAIYCTLANIEPLENVTKEEQEDATEMLRQEIESRVLTAKIYDNSIPGQLELVLDGDLLGDLGEFIASQGLGTPVHLNWYQVTNELTYIGPP